MSKAGENRSLLIDFPKIVSEEKLDADAGRDVIPEKSSCAALSLSFGSLFVAICAIYSVVTIILSQTLEDNCEKVKLFSLNVRSYALISGILDLVLAFEGFLCLLFIFYPRKIHKYIPISIFSLNIITRTFWYIFGLILVNIINGTCDTNEAPVDTPIYTLAGFMWCTESASICFIILCTCIYFSVKYCCE